MKKIIVTTMAYLYFTVVAAWGQDAIEFYNRGVNSTLAYKKIELFTKAIQLNPNLVAAYEKRALHYCHGQDQRPSFSHQPVFH